jgi:hypothetical protein
VEIFERENNHPDPPTYCAAVTSKDIFECADPFNQAAIREALTAIVAKFREGRKQR